MNVRRNGASLKKLVPYNTTVSSVIEPQIKKTANSLIDVNTSHSNTEKRRQCQNMRNVQAVVK